MLPQTLGSRMAATCSSEALVLVYQFCGITLQKKVPLSAEFITTSQMCTRHTTEVYVLQSIKMHVGKENFWHELQNMLKPHQSNTTTHTGNAHKRLAYRYGKLGYKKVTSSCSLLHDIHPFLTHKAYGLKLRHLSFQEQLVTFSLH